MTFLAGLDAYDRWLVRNKLRGLASLGRTASCVGILEIEERCYRCAMIGLKRAPANTMTALKPNTMRKACRRRWRAGTRSNPQVVETWRYVLPVMPNSFQNPVILRCPWASTSRYFDDCMITRRHRTIQAQL